MFIERDGERGAGEKGKTEGKGRNGARGCDAGEGDLADEFECDVGGGGVAGFGAGGELKLVGIDVCEDALHGITVGEMDGVLVGGGVGDGGEGGFGGD